MEYSVRSESASTYHICQKCQNDTLDLMCFWDWFFISENVKRLKKQSFSSNTDHIFALILWQNGDVTFDTWQVMFTMKNFHLKLSFAIIKFRLGRLFWLFQHLRYFERFFLLSGDIRRALDHFGLYGQVVLRSSVRSHSVALIHLEIPEFFFE